MRKIDFENGIIRDIVDVEQYKAQVKSWFDKECISNSVDDDIIQLIIAKGESNYTESDIKRITYRNYLNSQRDTMMAKIENYKPLELVPYSGDEYDEETMSIFPTFVEENGIVYERYDNPVIDKSKVREVVKKAKQRLSDTDYIIIKAYEARLTNQDSPYDQEYLDNVVAERQALRERINELEEILK